MCLYDRLMSEKSVYKLLNNISSELGNLVITIGASTGGTRALEYILLKHADN